MNGMELKEIEKKGLGTYNKLKLTYFKGVSFFCFFFPYFLWPTEVCSSKE